MVSGTRLRLAGLHIGSATVVARTEASGGDLVGARRALRERWASTARRASSRLLRERLPWTTIVRCYGPADAARSSRRLRAAGGSERAIPGGGHRARSDQPSDGTGPDRLAGRGPDRTRRERLAVQADSPGS